MKSGIIIMSCIEFRWVIVDQATVVFTETSPIGGRPARFQLYKCDEFSLWTFDHVDGWGQTSCSHIMQAYEFVKTNILGEHEPFAKLREPTESRYYMRPRS